MMAAMLVCLLPAATMFADDGKDATPIAGPTEQHWQTALTRGQAHKGSEMGLVLEDSGRKWGNALAAGLGGGAAMRNTSSGFSAVIYTPLAWASQLAAGAAKQYKQLTLTDLTDEDMQPIVRVVIHADTPNYVVGGVPRSSVEHAVLRSEDKKHVVQPISIEPIDESIRNAMGGEMELAGAVATFPLDQVTALRQLAEDGEFFLTVIGNGRHEKNFKIKTKHLNRLP